MESRKLQSVRQVLCSLKYAIFGFINCIWIKKTRDPFCVKIFAFVDRIPQTKALSMVGLEFGLQVSPLTTCNCPMLQVLLFLTPACGLFFYCESGSGARFFNIRFYPYARDSECHIHAQIIKKFSLIFKIC